MAIDPTLTLSGLETTTEGIDGVLLKWTNDGDGCLTYAARNTVEVHRATTNDRSQATNINETEGNTYIDQGFSTRQTFYYWVRAKNESGQVGPWEPSGSTNGVAGTPTTQDPDGVRNDLNVEDGATDGANFNTNLLNIPDRITNNADAGLNVTDTHLGYYDGFSWQVFIRDNGNFQFNGDSGNFIAWDGISLDIRGKLNADDINAGTIDANRISAAERLRVGSPSNSGFTGGIVTQAQTQGEGGIVAGTPGVVIAGGIVSKFRILTQDDLTVEGDADFQGNVSGITASDVGALDDSNTSLDDFPDGTITIFNGGIQEGGLTHITLGGSTWPIFNNFDTQVSGDFDVTGALSKGSGSFVIRHPQPGKQNQELAHSFVETDSCGDNLYRRRVTATQHDEIVEIPFPDYWPWLNTDPQAWAEPAELSFARCAAKVSDDLTKVWVRCEEPGTYDVLIMATRKDEVAVNNWKGVERDATRE